MDGIVIIDKPEGYTSRDIVNILSKKLETKKVGHTGTLDPMATGVLVICIGKATKLVEILTSNEKEYVAQVTLGIRTDTLDITGNILEERKVNISEQEIDKALEELIGCYEQEVPIYSAVKVKGKKLYEYARNNEDVILPKRDVEIKSLKRVSDINYDNGKIVFSIQATVSKGTYIRTLVSDIANKLGTIGTMSSLRRIRQGKFNINDAYTLDDFDKNNVKILSISEALKDIYSVQVNSELEFKIKNGVQLKDCYNKEYVLFKDKLDNVLALYKKDEEFLKVYKMF